jgi:hypothetical protein
VWVGAERPAGSVEVDLTTAQTLRRPQVVDFEQEKIVLRATVGERAGVPAASTRASTSRRAFGRASSL